MKKNAAINGSSLANSFIQICKRLNIIVSSNWAITHLSTHFKIISAHENIAYQWGNMFFYLGYPCSFTMVLSTQARMQLPKKAGMWLKKLAGGSTGFLNKLIITGGFLYRIILIIGCR
jgi:hypothetical protein